MTILQLILVGCAYAVAGCCGLLYTSNFASDRGGFGGWSCRRAFWDGSRRPWQLDRRVAGADLMDTDLPIAVLPRISHLGSPIYLVTWRITRRFGWRGLVVFIGAVAVIGPPRDSCVRLDFPGVDGFCSGCRTSASGRRGLYRYRSPWTRRDAPDRWSRHCRPALTGYTFFSNIRPQVRNMIKRRSIFNKKFSLFHLTE